jgi:hypothetical protein
MSNFVRDDGEEHHRRNQQNQPEIQVDIGGRDGRNVAVARNGVKALCCLDFRGVDS